MILIHSSVGESLTLHFWGEKIAYSQRAFCLSWFDPFIHSLSSTYIASDIPVYLSSEYPRRLLKLKIYGPCPQDSDSGVWGSRSAFQLESQAIHPPSEALSWRLKKVKSSAQTLVAFLFLFWVKTTRPLIPSYPEKKTVL